MSNRTQDFWDQQAEWSEATFGITAERGPLGALKHLEKEAKEAQVESRMLDSFLAMNHPDYISDAEACKEGLSVEIADCLFLTLDAARRAGMTLDQLLDTAFAKLEVNKKRKWGKPTTDGPVEHIREE